MDLGIGVKCIDSELRVKYETLKRVIIADKMSMDCLGEELRVLYVALTRAKEKLIMTANMKKLADSLLKEIKRQPELAHGVSQGKELIPFSYRLGALSYIDFILPALIRHPAIRDIAEKYELSDLITDKYMDNADGVPPFFISSESIEDIIATNEAESIKGILRADDITAFYDKELADKLIAKLQATYGHEKLKGLFTKTTVTELKKRMLEEAGEHFTAEAEYVAEAEATADSLAGAASDGLTGAERGTAYHRAMELLDYSVGDSADALKSYYEGLVQKNRMGRAAVDSLDLKDLQIFLGTDLGKRMGDAYKTGNLMREKPFMMGVSAKELDDKFPDDEMVLVQGIIDAWFMEGDDIILMDYKTDHVRYEDDLVKRYKIQLDLYKRALEASTGKRVKEIYIYSFALGKEIKL